MTTLLTGIVLTYVPGAVTVTTAVKLQLARAAKLPSLRAIFALPGVAVTVPAPHVVEAPAGEATTMPAGSASVTMMPVSATEFGSRFATVIVSPARPFGVMTLVENALVNVTAAALPTVSVAAAGSAFVAPCALVSAPAGIVLTY